MTLTKEEEQWVKEQFKEYNKVLRAKEVDKLDLSSQERMIKLKEIYPERNFDVPY